MKKYEISPDFTIEDIHKVRQMLAEKCAGMPDEFREREIEKGAQEMRDEIARLRREKEARK